jgi:hypothetical protein
MTEVKKEKWLDLLALTTVIFAICATLSTFKGGGYSTRSVLSQEQASDQWNFFQAKSIRESLYVVQKENLELQLTLPANENSEESKNRYKEALTLAESNIQKYKNQKIEIEKTAREFEAKRDEAQKHGQPFGLAVIFFQIAILLCSIAGLFKRKEIWFVALPVGIVGLIYFANGFLLFV